MSPNIGQVHKPIDRPQQVTRRNMILKVEFVKQRHLAFST